MESCLPDLDGALSGKRIELEELIDLTVQEQQCIINIDVAGLELLDTRKRELLVSMERTNSEFRRLMKKASEELKVAPAETLTPLITNAAQPMRETLKVHQTKLVELGETLSKALEFNRELLNDTLRHVHESLQFLKTFFTQLSTYGEGGNFVRSPDQVRLVCKEV